MELQKTRFLQSFRGHYIHVKTKKKIISGHMTVEGLSHKKGGHDSSVLGTCARPRIVSESVNASEISTQTATWSALL